MITYRANARFRLEQYELAAQDASEALEVDEACVKARCVTYEDAYYHMPL